MAASCEKLDHLVKDYLLFRGFTSTLKALDQELKVDKDRGLRVDRMMEQIWSLLAVYDLQGLRDYWRYLNQRLFARLEQRYAPSIRKLDNSLLKLYIVNAHQCGRQDKVLAFFEQMGAELQSNADFRDWFAFPFITTPADNPVFSLYFNKQWQDTLQLSLHNFLSVVLQAMPVPTLLNVEFDARRMKSLLEENTSLKQQLMGASRPEQVRSKTRRTLHTEMHPPSSTPDMVYDFSGLSSDIDRTNQEKPKTTRRFPLSLTSPLTSRKKSTEAIQAKAKQTVGITGHGSTLTQSQAQASGGYVNIIAQPRGQTTGPPHINIPAQQQGHTTNTAQSSVKSTEMTSFPPPHSKQADLKKSSSQAPAHPVTSQTPSSMNAAVAASGGTKMLAITSGPKQTGTGTKAPPPLVSKSASASSAESLEVPEPPLVNRSLSTPSAKPVVTRPTLAKHSSENLTSSSPDVSTSAASSVSHLAMRSKSIVDRSASPNLDPNNPFLSLEDEYSEHATAVSFCRFSLSGQHVASLDVDGIVKVWIWSPQPATTATVMSKSAFLSLAWAGKSDRWLLLGNKTGTIRLFDVKESKTFREVSVNPDNDTNCLRVTDLSSSPSGTQFVCATADYCPFSNDIATVSGKLLQWDLRTLKLERSLVVDSAVCSAVTCSSYSQTGHLLLTGGADGFIRIYDTSQQRPVVKWQAHSSPISSVMFNGDKSVLSLGSHGKLCEWSLAKPGQPLMALNTNRSEIPRTYSGSPRTRLFSLDMDNQYLLTGSGNRGVIYKMANSLPPTKVMDLKSHAAPVVTVDWSPLPATRVCLTGSVDGKIKILTLLDVEIATKKTSN